MVILVELLHIAHNFIQQAMSVVVCFLFHRLTTLPSGNQAPYPPASATNLHLPWQCLRGWLCPLPAGTLGGPCHPCSPHPTLCVVTAAAQGPDMLCSP